MFFRFDFIAAPIVHPRYKREYFGVIPPRSGPLTRSDKVIKVSEWGSLVVAKLSPWIQLDSDDEVVRRNSEKVRMCACSSPYCVFFFKNQILDTVVW